MKEECHIIRDDRKILLNNLSPERFQEIVKKLEEKGIKVSIQSPTQKQSSDILKYWRDKGVQVDGTSEVMNVKISDKEMKT